MYRTIPIPMAVASLIVAAALAQAQAQSADEAVGVHDGAKLFSTAALKAAEQGLREVQSGSEGRWQVLVTTVDSLHGKAPRDLAVEAAEKARLKGLSVVISKADKKVFVEPSRSAESAFPAAERERVVAAITNAFKKGDFDRGLRDAVAEVRFAALGVGVRDGAAMFTPEAVAKADEALDALRRRTNWGAAIETVASLKGRPRREAADTNARASKVHGLYVLISKGDKTIDAVPSHSAEATFTRDRIKSIDDAVTSAFKAGDFDKGLTDAVATIRRDAEAGSPSIARAPVVVKSDEPAPPRPSVPAAIPPAIPPATPAAQPAANEAGSALPVLLVVGGVVLMGLWLLSKLFRRSGAAPQQQPGYGYPQGQPVAQPGPRPGYGPQMPPAPGYGPPPAPGYGYGPPPPQQGGGGMGGMVTGALGGLGGALAGNLLYDQMTHRHEGQGPAHNTGGVVPPAGSNWPPANTGAGAPPPESYDPNAGAGGSWGAPDQPAANPDADPNAGTGGNWGTPDEPTPDADGSWGAPEEQPSPDAGGDWSGPDESAPAPDSGGDDQGGSW